MSWIRTGGLFLIVGGEGFGEDITPWGHLKRVGDGWKVLDKLCRRGDGLPGRPLVVPRTPLGS